MSCDYSRRFVVVIHEILHEIVVVRIHIAVKCFGLFIILKAL